MSIQSLLHSNPAGRRRVFHRSVDAWTPALRRSPCRFVLVEPLQAVPLQERLDLFGVDVVALAVADAAVHADQVALAVQERAARAAFSRRLGRFPAEHASLRPRLANASLALDVFQR